MTIILIDLSWIFLSRRQYTRLEAKMRYAVLLICGTQITGQVAGNPTAFTLIAFLGAMYGCKATNLLLA